MSGNRTLGNGFESRLAGELAKHGFWVHLLKQSQDGQPADIIAVKNNTATLIDAKVCSDGFFRTSRIESNQEGSMMVWGDSGNDSWWFALEMPDGSIYMIPGQTALHWELFHRSPTIRWAELKEGFLTLERWCERWS